MEGSFDGGKTFLFQVILLLFFWQAGKMVERGV